MSANSTVTCLRSPSRLWRETRIFSERCGGVYDRGARGVVAGESSLDVEQPGVCRARDRRFMKKERSAQLENAEDIIADVQSKMPGVNKTTIYRTLELLEKTGCVLRGASGNGSIYHRTEEGHHHHLICSKCGTSIDCEENLFSPVEDSLARKFGFTASFKHFVVHGFCRNCSRMGT